MPDPLTLEIAGTAYGGWTAVSVVRSIESISGGFSLRVSERWPGQPETRTIRPGERCSIRIGAEAVISGYVDEVEITRAGTDHQVSCRGRDAAGDLVDCSPDLSPGEWHGRTVLEIASDLAAPFGIAVRAEVPVGAAFTKVSLDPGASVYDAIEELCKYRALLPVSDGQGAIVLTRAGAARAVAGLVEGENLLEESLTLSWVDRFSRYTVKGQAQGSDLLFGEAASGAVGRASDTEVERHRPKVVIASKGITAEQAQQRAQWEATVRAGRSAVAHVTVVGWRQGPDETGPLWPVNAIVQVRSATLGLAREMLISELEYVLDESGRKTRLHLVRPDAFALLAEPEEEQGGLGFDPLGIFGPKAGVTVGR